MTLYEITQPSRWRPFVHLTAAGAFKRSRYFTVFATKRWALLLIHDPGKDRAALHADGGMCPDPDHCDGAADPTQPPWSEEDE